MTRGKVLSLFLSPLFLVMGSEPISAQWWGPTYRSSTVGEANARGLGALIRDQGEANLLNSEAMINVETARSQYIANTVDAVQAYYDRKRVREAYYAPIKEEKKAQLDRFVARRGTIPEISQEDVDPSSGQISWPAVLQSPTYDAFRNEYQQLFSKYMQAGSLSGEESMRMHQISRDWRKQIGKDRKMFGEEPARQAIRFILALDKQFGQS